MTTPPSPAPATPLHAALWGVVAEFDTPEAVLAAADAAYLAGYRALDAYSPYPVEGLAEALGVRGNRIPLVTLVGGLAGGAVGYFMLWYANAVSYPLNVGGRPHDSWPAFIPITFETTILVAAFSAFLGLLWMNGLPQPYHPVFHAEAFRRASQDRFFLSVEAADPAFDRDETLAFLASLGARSVQEVQP